LSKKEEQSEATRIALIGAAKKLFAARGYGGVSMEEVVRNAGVTRGALYHHYSGKKDLFQAVYETVEREVTEAIATDALQGHSPWEMSQIGWRSFLDRCRDDSVSRIVLLDAPSVLGVEAFRAVADQYGGALVRANIQALIEAGELEQQPVEPLARILTGALIEGAISIAQSNEPETTRDQMSAAIERLMEGMRVSRSA